MLSKIFKGFGKKEKYTYKGDNQRLKEIFDLFEFNKCSSERFTLTKQQKIKITAETNQIRVIFNMHKVDPGLIATLDKLEQIVINAPER